MGAIPRVPARIAAIAVGFVCAAAACGGGGGPALDITKVGVVALPGKSTRFDYISLDPLRHLLVVAHLGDDAVVAVDTAQKRVAWVATGVASAHGVTIDTAAGRVYATATATNEVVALDEATGHELFRSPTGRFPDGVAVDPVSSKVWVSNKDGGTETVIDAVAGRSLATVAVGADTGNVVFDASSRQMVVAVGRSNELVLIDAAGMAIRRRVPIPGCRGAHGVALTPGFAFVACEDNARVFAVDLGTGRITGAGTTGATPDVLAFDSARARLYVAAEDGVVAALDFAGGALALRGRERVASGAHTIAVDPRDGRVYLPLPDIGGHPGLEILEPKPARD